MELAAKLVLTLAVGTGCGFLFRRLKVPAAFMIGAFAGVSCLNVVLGWAWVPHDTGTAVQVIAGAFVGCSMERSDVVRLRTIGGAVGLMLVSFLVLFIALGFAIWAATPLDLVTSLMSVVPGGINDTPIVAADMGADAPVVAVLQLVRQVLGIGLFPLMIATFDRSRTTRGFADARGDQHTGEEQRVRSTQKSWQALSVTVVAATAAGLLGKATGVPGFTFSSAIVAALVLKLCFDFAYLPKGVKKACQIVAGSYLGTLLTVSGLRSMGQLVVPIVIVVVGYTVNCFATGRLESRLLGYGRKEGMLIASPAGASDMALIIEDLGVDNTDVIIMQVVRAIVVMAVFPQIVNAICLFTGT